MRAVVADKRKRYFIRARPVLAATAAIVLAWLIVSVVKAAFGGIGVLVVIAAAILGAVPAIRLIRRRSLLKKVRSTTDDRLNGFLKRRGHGAGAVHPDKSGHQKWGKEIPYFIEQHVHPILTPGEHASLSRNYSRVVSFIADRLEAAQNAEPGSQKFPRDLRRSG